MNLKRVLGLVILVLAIAWSINIIGSYKQPQLKNISQLQITTLGETGYRFTGVIEVYNPSIFQLRLNSLILNFKLNNIVVGSIDNPINFTISSKTTGLYPFEIRFAKSDISLNRQENITAHFTGCFGNSSLFSKLNVEIDKTETLSIK